MRRLVIGCLVMLGFVRDLLVLGVLVVGRLVVGRFAFDRMMRVVGDRCFGVLVGGLRADPRIAGSLDRVIGGFMRGGCIGDRSTVGSRVETGKGRRMAAVWRLPVSAVIVRAFDVPIRWLGLVLDGVCSGG